MDKQILFPNHLETKGSLFLRSNHMQYHEDVKNSTWHLAAQAHPKDFDLRKSVEKKENPNLLLSTYKHLGTDKNQPDYKSTTHLALEQLKLLPITKQQEKKQYIVDNRSFKNKSKRNESCILKHQQSQDKMYLISTQRTDYQPPYPFKEAPKKQIAVENVAAFKKQVSQFTDVDTYKRNGIHTFHDESGCYNNFKEKQLMFKKTDPMQLVI